MKRKNFLKGAVGVAAAGALLGGKATAQETEKPDCDKRMAGKNKFIMGWMAAWLGNMRKGLPEAEAARLIEENGRSCAGRGAVAWAKSFDGDLDRFLAAMRREIGENNVRRDGGRITLVYDKCFCPLVGDIPGTLPAEYCHCTVGWTKAVYGEITGKPVKVGLRSSVKRGDARCLIEVEIA
jgi:hypothetical protein